MFFQHKETNTQLRHRLPSFFLGNFHKCTGPRLGIRFSLTTLSLVERASPYRKGLRNPGFFRTKNEGMDFVFPQTNGIPFKTKLKITVCESIEGVETQTWHLFSFMSSTFCPKLTLDIGGFQCCTNHFGGLQERVQRLKKVLPPFHPHTNLEGLPLVPPHPTIRRFRTFENTNF